MDAKKQEHTVGDNDEQQSQGDISHAIEKILGTQIVVLTVNQTKWFLGTQLAKILNRQISNMYRGLRDCNTVTQKILGL